MDCASAGTNMTNVKVKTRIEAIGMLPAVFFID
jgi:hypothetical protein